MRSINITGKHNIDKMNELENESYQAERKCMLTIDNKFFDHKPQVEMINKLFMDCNFDLKSLFIKEINHKIQGYKGQDIKKEIHDNTSLIQYNEVVEKLVEKRLKCNYCKKPVFILYKNVREPSQWTLDRIDNNINHSNINTCISCLKCNLQRRMMHVDKFTFTKQLKINKV